MIQMVLRDPVFFSSFTALCYVFITVSLVDLLVGQYYKVSN
jgi:hypothetical protein